MSDSELTSPRFEPCWPAMWSSCARHANAPTTTSKVLVNTQEAMKSYKEAMIRKRGNQKEIPTPKTKVGKTKLTIRYLYSENIVSRVSSYFPIGGHSVTQA